MDYLTSGRRALAELVHEYERIERAQSQQREIFSAGLVDEERGIYVTLSFGWHGKTRVCVVYFLVRIKDDKFYIEEDGTEEGVATDLLNAGVPNDKIVLAFRHPSMREYTEFAVA
jgi:hypothetical protein